MFENHQVDLKRVQQILKQPTTKQFVDIWRRLQDVARFQIGDFIVETRKAYDGTILYTENVTNSGIPARFMITYRDEETGLTFASRINANGKLGQPQCLETKMGFQYELDPAYEDHILLGGKYSPIEDLEETRKHAAVVKKYNKSIVFIPRSPAEFDKFIADHLSVPGTVFWWCYTNSRDAAEQHAEIISVGQRPLLPTDWRDAELMKKGLKTVACVTYRTHENKVETTDTAYWWHYHEFYLTKPMSYRLREK